MSDLNGGDQVPAAPLAANPSALWALALGLASFLVGYGLSKFVLSEPIVTRGAGQLLPVQPAHQYAVVASICLSLIAVMLALPSFSRRRIRRSYGLLGMAVAILMLAWDALRITEWYMKG